MRLFCHSHTLLALFVWTFALGQTSMVFGCLIETVPLPEVESDPVGPGTTDKTINDKAVFYATEPAILVGTTGAVLEDAEVVAINIDRNNWTGRTQAGWLGSFNMPLHALVGDKILVQAFLQGIMFDRLLIEIKPPEEGTQEEQENIATLYNANQDASDIHIAADPDTDNMVTVSGPTESLDPNTTVIIANLTQGASVAASVQPDGSFEATLPGVSGNLLSIFVVDSTHAGAQPVEMVVP